MPDTNFTSLDSERLILRGFNEADLAPFLAYLNDPLVARYQSWESYTKQAAREAIERLRMRREGHFIQNVWFKGKWGDEYQYALLREEWLGRRTG